MPTFGEVLYTGVAKYRHANPTVSPFIGHWKLGEPVGSTVLRNTAEDPSPGTDGAPVGDVTLGRGSLVKQSPDGAAELGVHGGYIEVPDHASIDCQLLSVGIWFRPLVDIIPLAACLWAKFDETSGTTATNDGFTGNGTYVNSPSLNQIGAIPERTLRGVRFNGVDQYATFPHFLDLQFNDGFMIAWHGSYNSYAGGDRYTLAKNDDTTSAGYSIRRTAAGTFVFRRNNQSYAFTVPGGTVLNRMNHYCVWYDDLTQTLRWIFNGVAQATFTGVTFPDSAGTAALQIARSAAGADYDDVTLDNLVMYYLHPIFTSALMTLKRIVDTSQGLIINYQGGRFFGLVGKDNAYGLEWNTFIGGGGLELEIWIGGSRHIASIGNQHFLNTQTYFISGSYNGATLRLHRDGVELDNTATGGGFIDQNNNPLRIGVSRSQTPIQAVVDEVILFNTPIMDSGVTGLSPLELYTAGITERTEIVCPPRPTPHRERVIYVRPDAVGTRNYILHAPPTRALLSVEGFGTPPLEYVTDRAPFQHGDTVRAFHLAPRQVQLTVLHNFDSRAAYRDGRAELLAMLRPNALQPANGLPALSPERQGKLLCYLGNGTKRQLDVLLDSGPGFAPSQGGWREWSFIEVLRFTAHNPTWYDPRQNVAQMVQAGSSQVVFPVTFPVVVSETSFSVVIEYAGDWPEKPVITVFGPITSPVVTNISTGKKLELQATIPAGMVVSFDTANARVERGDGVSMLGYLSADSDLTEWTLEPEPIAANGFNTIVVTGTGLSATPPPTVMWYSRYMGI